MSGDHRTRLPPTGDGPAALYRYGDRLWWPVGMRRITWAILGRLDGRLLDVGAGPGWDLVELPAGVWGVGLDRDARPKVVAGPFVSADASRLPFSNAAFDAVWSLDLLEQSGVDPSQTLGDIVRVLRPGGRLLARVPAHPWLYGPHDRVWGGARRYRRLEFAALICQSGLRIRRMTYANSVLFVPAVVARLLGRAGLGSGRDLKPMAGPINQLLRGVLAMEAHWLARCDMPIGLSLLCLAEKS